jgi:hypothetical protein
MKQLTIIPSNLPAYFDNGIVIDIPGEKWGFSLNSIENDSATQRECVEIRFLLPNGKRWEGTITDFSAIFSIVANALIEVRNFGSFDSNVIVSELENVLSHLK